MRLIIISLLGTWLLGGQICIANPIDAYRDYEALKSLKKIEQHNGMKTFLSKHAESIFAYRVRMHLLNHLAKQADWTAFIEYYRPQSNVALRCHYQHALLQAGDNNALRVAKNIWLSGKSRPKACDKLFLQLEKNKLLSEALLLKRIQLALAASNWRLATYLIKKLPAQKQASYRQWLKWFKKPGSFLKTPVTDTLAEPMLVSMILKKGAFAKPHLTAKRLMQWQAFHPLPNTDEILQGVVLKLALRRDLAVEHWFKKMSNPPDAVHAWRARNALFHNNWSVLKEAITAMPEALAKKDCWQYWLAKAHEQLGENQLAKAIWTNIQSSTSYYGLLATLALDKTVSPPPKRHYNLQDYKPSQSIVDIFSKLFAENSFHRAHLLSASLEKNTDRQAEILALYHQLGWHYKAIRFMRVHPKHYHYEIDFPLPFADSVEQFSQEYKISKAWVYAVMRQESRFQAHVKSPRGARGLMQIMPNTGKSLARTLGKRLSNHDLLKPKINIQLGSYYIKQLHENFSHPVLATAAYNAGSTTVKKWLRKQKPTHFSIWIETLPWFETRKYLKNVIYNYLHYQTRLGEKLDLSDIEKPIGQN